MRALNKPKENTLIPSIPVWWTALKDLVIPFVAVLVAVVGWIITAQNNKTQTEIARKKNDADTEIARTNADSSKKKNEADIEIAKTNAAIAFLQLYDKIPNAESERRARLVAISLPILPERSAFELAVQNLDHDSGAIRSLFALYGERSWYLLEPYLGHGPVYRTAEFSPDIEFDSMPQTLLSFLYQNNMMSGIDEYLLDDIGSGGLTPARENVFVNYFRFLRSKQDENKQETMNQEKRKEMLSRFQNDNRLLPETKAYISIAGAVCFAYGGGDSRDDSLLRNATDSFWVGLEISRGEIPTEDSLRGYFYRHDLYYRDVYGRVVVLPERDALSRSLMEQIGRIKGFPSSPWENISVMMYSYLAYTPRDTESPFVAFLRPSEGAKFMDMVYAWANTVDRRRDLGQALNSLEGSSILRNLGPKTDAQRHFAEATVRFFEDNYSSDWYPARILQEIVDEYPDLKSNLHRKDYGFAN